MNPATALAGLRIDGAELSVLDAGDAASVLIVEVHAAGHSGWGAAPVQAQDAVGASLEGLMGAPLMDWNRRSCVPGAGAVECARLDLAARIAELPAALLLAGFARERVAARCDAADASLAEADEARLVTDRHSACFATRLAALEGPHALARRAALAEALRAELVPVCLTASPLEWAIAAQCALALPALSESIVVPGAADLRILAADPGGRDDEARHTSWNARSAPPQVDRDALRRLRSRATGFGGSGR